MHVWIVNCPSWNKHNFIFSKMSLKTHFLSLNWFPNFKCTGRCTHSINSPSFHWPNFFFNFQNVPKTFFWSKTFFQITCVFKDGLEERTCVSLTVWVEIDQFLIFSKMSPKYVSQPKLISFTWPVAVVREDSFSVRIRDTIYTGYIITPFLA